MHPFWVFAGVARRVETIGVIVPVKLTVILGRGLDGDHEIVK